MEAGVEGGDGVAKKKSKHEKGPKGPNPLAVKKPKKRSADEGVAPTSRDDNVKQSQIVSMTQEGTEAPDPSTRRKRRRKHKSGGNDGSATTLIKTTWRRIAKLYDRAVSVARESKVHLK